MYRGPVESIEMTDKSGVPVKEINSHRSGDSPRQDNNAIGDGSPESSTSNNGDIERDDDHVADDDNDDAERDHSISTPYDQYDEKSNCGSLIPIVFYSIIIAMGGLIFGYDIGTIGGLVELPMFKRAYGDNTQQNGFKEVTLGLLIGISALSACIGGLVPILISNKIGIRPTIMIGSVCYAVGNLLSLISPGRPYLWLVFIGRVFNGLGIGDLCVVCPLLISELTPRFVSGTLISMQQLFTTVGILVGSITLLLSIGLNPNSAWQYMMPLLVGLIISICNVIAMCFVPESPQWLINNVRKRYDKAKRSIARTRGLDINDEKVEFIFNELVGGGDSSPFVEQQDRNAAATVTNNGNRSLIYGEPKYFLRLLTGIAIWCIQQASGINYFFFFGTSLFQSIGINNGYLVSMILACVNLLFSIVSIGTIDRCYRKKLLLYGSGWMLVFMCIFTTLGSFLLPSVLVNKTVIGICMIGATVGFIGTFAMTWGPVANIMVSTINPQVTKVRAMAIAGSCSWVVNFTISLITPVLIKAMGFFMGYLFAVILLGSFFFVYYYVPEIKGLSMGDIDTYYEEL